MELRILGPLVLVHGGRHHAIASERNRTLLALLALSDEFPVPAHQLIDGLWADRPMQDARNALQANVARLRKLLESLTGIRGDALVRTVNSGYLLALPKQAVDAHQFVALAGVGESAVSDRPSEAIEILERALELWHGPALFDVCDGLRCGMEAAHLEERRLSVRQDLITAKLAVGAARGVVSELRALTVEHPERERFSEQLMLALYRDGRQTEALDVFHGARKRLAIELGVEPGHGLRRLYEAILVQDRGLDVRVPLLPGVA